MSARRGPRWPARRSLCTRWGGTRRTGAANLLRTSADGLGVVSLLELPQLQDRPKVFSTFLMWLLADLFQGLLHDSDTQRCPLRRARPARNGVQHALRAFTPEGAKALKATVSTFPRSGYDLEELLIQLGIGEAVITVLSERGAPTPVAWTRLRLPQSRMAPTDAAAIAAAVAASPLHAASAQEIDRESAYERLAARLAPAPERGPERAPDAPTGTRTGSIPRPTPRPVPTQEDSALERAVRSPAAEAFARSAARALGREIARSLFGTSRRRR